MPSGYEQFIVVEHDIVCACSDFAFCAAAETNRDGDSLGKVPRVMLLISISAFLQTMDKRTKGS